MRRWIQSRISRSYLPRICFSIQETRTIQQFVDTAKWLATDAAKYRENQPEQNEVPVLAIYLRLFHKDGFERAEELCLFKPHIGQHGSELGARDYFEEWINSYPGSNAAAATELHTSRLFACCILSCI